MIDAYLYQLFTNAPIFKGQPSNGILLKNVLKSEIERFCSAHRFSSQAQLLQHLLDTDYTILSKQFTGHPLVEIFYLVNSISEYKKENNRFDELDRLIYESSVQQTTGITKNRVLEKMLEFVQTHNTVTQTLTPKPHKSFFYLSHDIDSVYGSLTQDGLWALKKGRIDIVLQLLMNTVLQKPEWLNMDLIMKTESEYDFKSTFYWLVNQGRIDKRQSNSDYNIQDKKLKQIVAGIEKNGFENALHKSISPESFATELKKAPFAAKGNRYHYLKFNLPKGYNAIKESGLKTDASLGFAEHYGFRNNYGYPFQPFDIVSGKPYPFLEIPLNVMDGTFQRYMKLPVDKTASTVIDFLEQNKYNSLISILWHNPFFARYKHAGYLSEYKKILAYLYEEKFTCLKQQEIIDRFSWEI